MYKRESSSNDRKGGSKPFVKTTAAKKTGSSSPRSGKSFDKPAGKGFGDKKPYGKSTRGQDKKFDEAPRNKRSFGEDRLAGKSFSGRKPESDRPRFGESDASKSYDRETRKPRSTGSDRNEERSYSGRKPTGTRTNFRDKNESKPFERGARKTGPFADKTEGRSFSDRKPSSTRSNFRDKKEATSFDREPRKTRSFNDKTESSSFSDRKSSSTRSNFRDKKEPIPFEREPRKTRSFGDEKANSEGKNPRATNPYNRSPRKSATTSEQAPRSFSDRKNSKKEGVEGGGKSFSTSAYGKDDKLKSRSGRGPRKSDLIAEKKKAQKDDKPQMGNIRLNRFIANAGICSRREADALITAGLVTVNGESIVEMGYQVKPTDDVRYNGERLSREKKVYVLLNKPKDAITTSEDPEGRRTVMQLFGNELGERIYPVGRLDRNTTGVLLFTNDGDLAQRLMHPSYEMKKVYKATLNKTFKGEDMWQLTNGVDLEDGFIKPDAIAYPDAKDKTEVGIEIHSGKNHIIHRMFEHLGYKVDKLDRALYAGLTKGKLKRGEWRELTEKEINTIKRMVKLS
jgi:23S rRNA pseudouridine2605 synthase